MGRYILELAEKKRAAAEEALPLEGTQEAEPPELEMEETVHGPRVKAKTDIRIEPNADLKKKPPGAAGAKRIANAMQGVAPTPEPKAKDEPDPFTANLFED